MNNIAIIGTGVYGIAMAHALSQNKNNKIKMWTESPQAHAYLDANRNSFPTLNNIYLDESIEFSESYEEVMQNADIVYIMCAAKFVTSVCNQIKDYINPKMHFVIGSKGIEQDSCKFVHEIFLENIKTSRVAVISGASFAIDIASLDPIGLSLGCIDQSTINYIKSLYENTNIKLRSTNDLIGVEIGGSIKNVIAVATGMLEGLKYSESTRCFLITEAVHEIKKLIGILGGSESTILSYSGIGDLVLTTTSTKSRNYSFGLLLGSGNYEEAMNYINNTTVEGYYTLESINTLLTKKNISMPLISIIYDIVKNNGNPEQLKDYLLNTY